MGGATEEWKAVGTIVGLNRYVLKGTGGDAVAQAKLGWHGLAFDRRYGLHRTHDMSGLPWVSARQFPNIASWRSSLDGDGNLIVITNEAEEAITVDPDDEAERAKFSDQASSVLGEDVRLFSLWSGTFDSMSLSIITTDTLAAVADAVGVEHLDARRFRSNIVIDTGGARPWPERKWLGRELRLGVPGSPIVRIDRHTTRCEVVDLDPDTGEADHDVFAAVRAANRNRAGVYASTRQVGVVSVEAAVFLR